MQYIILNNITLKFSSDQVLLIFLPPNHLNIIGPKINVPKINAPEIIGPKMHFDERTTKLCEKRYKADTKLTCFYPLSLILIVP